MANEKIEQAQRFAHEAHDSIGQKRKYSGEPYWVHTDAVASLVASVGGTEDMVIAAHLHDVIEDVFPVKPEYSLERIAKLFGNHAADLVSQLTDVYTRERYPDLNRKQRKQMELDRVAGESAEVHTIKLADLINNTESIVAHDKDFARVYIREKLNMLPHLSDGHPELLQRASMQALAACQVLGIHIPMLGAS